MLSLKKVLIEFLTSNFVDWYNVFNNWTAIWEKSYPWFLSEITCLNTPWIVLHSVQLWGSTKYKYPQKRLLEIARGWGVSKTNIFKGKYEPELEFLERGGGFKTKSLPCEGHRYFLETHITYSVMLTWLVAAFLAAISASSFLFSSACLCSSISFFFFSASLFFASWASLICSFFNLAYGKYTTKNQDVPKGYKLGTQLLAIISINITCRF